MNILFANMRPPYPFIIGGDGPIIHTYFTFLVQQGHSCTWLGTSLHAKKYVMPHHLARLWLLHKQGYAMRISLQKKFSHFSHGLFFNKTYPCHIVNPHYFQQELRNHIQMDKPDILITQLEGAEHVIRIAHQVGIPVILFITDNEASSFARITQDQSSQPSGIACLSQFVASNIPSYVSAPIHVFHPPLIEEEYKTFPTGDYITCINPIRVKGGEIIREIIYRLPNQRFLLVKGWYDPRDEALDFRRIPNVTIMEKQFDMRNVYRQTKLLLIPSVWNEAFSRVILEAGVNGIPSIASNRGGIAEAVGTGGILITTPTDIDAWTKEITALLEDNKMYEILSRRIQAHTRKFRVEIIGSAFQTWMTRLIKKHNA